MKTKTPQQIHEQWQRIKAYVRERGHCSSSTCISWRDTATAWRTTTARLLIGTADIITMNVITQPSPRQSTQNKSNP